MRSLLMAAALVVLLSDCSARRASVGGQCELNSQCAAPLVCRLGYCRNECATSEDCPAGLSCVLDEDGLGACQLPAETSCTLSSECPPSLVCRFRECTNACETDRDCPGGARCEFDMAAPDGAGRACIDRSEQACSIDGACDPLGVGGPRTRCIAGRCRRECFTDRDCRNDFWCNGTEGACWPLPRYDAAAIDPGGDTGGRTGDADAAGLDANLDAAGLDAAGLDADLDAAGLDAAGLDGGTGPAMCTGTLFSGVDWRELHAGVNASVSIAASVAGRLVFSTVTNFVTGPGGELHVLDVGARTWSTVPFPASRLRMSTTSAGSILYLNGGTWSTPGGDPYTDVATFDVSTSALGSLGGSVSEAREGGAMGVCGGHVVIGAGNPNNASSTGSTAVDLFDLSSPGASTALSLPDPYTNLGALVDGSTAYLAGGFRNLPFGSDYASDRLFVVDCAGNTLRELALPHFLGSASGAVLGREAYFTGARYRDGTTFLGLLTPSYDVVDILDLDTETWRTVPAPPPPAGASIVATSVMVGGRFVRALGNQVQVFDPTLGVWSCTVGGYPVAALLTDGVRLFVVGNLGTNLVIDAYLFP